MVRTLALCVAGSFGFVAAADRPIPHASAQAGPAGTTAAMPAQPVAASTSDARLTQPQLEQLLAPVALYPDALLAQMLMAATYPLEVVQAQRWLERGQRYAEGRGARAGAAAAALGRQREVARPLPRRAQDDERAARLDAAGR